MLPFPILQRVVGGKWGGAYRLLVAVAVVADAVLARLEDPPRAAARPLARLLEAVDAHDAGYLRRKRGGRVSKEGG